MTEAATEFEKALLALDRLTARDVLMEFYRSDGTVQSIEKVVLPAMAQIGLGWEQGKLALSQVYMSGIICEELIEKYMDKIDVNIKKDLRIGIGVLLDHHALGKRIVYSILRVSGYNVLDFGQGLSVNEIVEKTIEKK